MTKFLHGTRLFAIGTICCSLVLTVCFCQEPAENTKPPTTKQDNESTQTSFKKPTSKNKIVASPITPFIANGIDWLLKAQHEDGGWGGGSHTAQNVRDPQAVPSDPATTAFTTMALVRAGNTPSSGKNSKAIRKAINYLVEVVEQADNDGPRITKIQGTQPQQKLGGLVDTTMTTQCLARVMKEMNRDDDLYSRVDKALEKCIAKLEKSQKEDGSWNVAGGWAPVLQSSSGQTALEFAQLAGKTVSKNALAKAVEYQSNNIDASGKAGVGGGRGGPDVSAGVELYSFSTGQRGNAANARFAEQTIEKAKASGQIKADASVSEDTLKGLGLADKDAKKFNDAFVKNEAQISRLGDEALLKGFGNNGGEEFVSFLLTSESMIIAGGNKWKKWNDKMHGTMQKIQNKDGSWSGHHCITNPTFCTAAVIQCLLADHDAEMLIEIAEQGNQKNESDDASPKKVPSTTPATKSESRDSK